MLKLSAAAFPKTVFTLPRPAALQAAVAAPGRTAAKAVATTAPTFRAEVRAKRLGSTSVTDDRYSATLPVTGKTPYDLITALAEACSTIEDLRAAHPGEERIVLEISLTSQAA